MFLNRDAKTLLDYFSKYLRFNANKTQIILLLNIQLMKLQSINLQYHKPN